MLSRKTPAQGIRKRHTSSAASTPGFCGGEHGRAGCQPFGDALFVRVAGEQHEKRVSGSELVSHNAAQLGAGNVR